MFKIDRIERTTSILLPLAVVALFFIIWEVGVFNKVFDIPLFVLPKPTTIFAYMTRKTSLFLEHASITFFESLAAFVIGSAFGMVLGVAIFQIELLRETIYPLLIMFNSVPKSAMAPLLIIWFGVGQIPAIALGAFIAFFPVLVNTMLGCGATPSELMDLAHSFKASSWMVFYKIRFPNALPYICPGIRIAATTSLVGVVVSEIVASDAGLGYLIVIAQSQMTMSLMFGGIILLLIMGLSFYLIAVLLGKFLIPWYKR
ncbi:MAG: ABC transporter permease [Candidatus Bathyarchaeota archaeon]|nr:MAG: ABC transporter permease [Candidatus Bathyarchaeota archaeon]